MTALLRGYVGATFLVLVVLGSLGKMWLTVAATDLVLAALQCVWLTKWRERQS